MSTPKIELYSNLEHERDDTILKYTSKGSSVTRDFQKIWNFAEMEPK